MRTPFPRRRSLLSAGLLLAAAPGVLAPSPAAAAGSPFTCEASVLRGTLLTAPALEPFVTNRGKACAERRHRCPPSACARATVPATRPSSAARSR